MKNRLSQGARALHRLGKQLNTRRDKVPPYEKRDIGEEEVREWLKKASLRKFNVFIDVNHIIFLLCHQLLKEMKKGKDKD